MQSKQRKCNIDRGSDTNVHGGVEGGNLSSLRRRQRRMSTSDDIALHYEGLVAEGFDREDA